ncbi:MAG: sigma 54-interacting transcriptional regulator [bacterium]
MRIVRDGETIEVGPAGVRIGRVAGNDLVVADPRISSRHARVVPTAEGAVFEDLGSRNGSIVERGGERIVARPHATVPLRPGDRLLLGDLVSPVVLQIEAGGARAATPEGTVVARRAMTAERDALDGADPAALRQLFRLLHDLSGRVDPEAVLARIVEAVLARFPHAASARILQRDPSAAGQWVVASSQGDCAAPVSSTLVQRAVEGRELVSYLPGVEVAPQSVVGLAGAVIVPLLSGEQAIGVLHVDSRRRHFAPDDLAWLSVVGTHVAASLVAARRFSALRSENDDLRGDARMPRPIVGQSPALARALDQLRRVARTATSVLVLGETGTGKELAARYVHAHSPRAEKVFAAINCAALPENLLESELFGHRKGAFTGADRDRKGLFESAEGGTVFLDEIGEISPAVQVRLLRVLQEREVQPVGARTPIQVDVRVVAATNRDLKAEAEAGNFREDLYYRLAVFPVTLPPLRDRVGDVRLLAERFRQAACARAGIYNPGFTADALAALEGYGWPGNVRQLEHEIERAVILAEEGEPIDLDSLSEAVAGSDHLAPMADGEVGLPRGSLRDVMARLEERVIRRCLEEHGGNRTRAAETLGISRQALQAKLAKWREGGGD